MKRNRKLKYIHLFKKILLKDGVWGNKFEQCNYKKLNDGERIQIRIESNLTSISSKIETENESFGIIGYNSIIPYNLTQYVQVINN